MRVWKTATVLSALAGVGLLLAACGGDEDGGDEETGIRTDRGLAVAAAGAAFDPRLQGADNGEESAGTGAGTTSVPRPEGSDVVSGGFAPDYAPVLQQGNTGITVQGYGTASADADSAIVEFYFFSGGGVEPQPAPDTGTSSSGSAGSAGAPGAGPGPNDVGVDIVQQEVAQITEGDLQPVIDALVAAGVPRDNIEFIAQGYYDRFSSSATLRATVGDLTVLDAAVNAASNAAAGLGAIQLSSTNVLYTVADCTALEEAAMREAVGDANERGAAFAQALGVGLGEITGASSYSYSPYGGNACGSAYGVPVPLAADSSASGGSRTVQVFANISVTYAIQ